MPETVDTIRPDERLWGGQMKAGDAVRPPRPARPAGCGVGEAAGAVAMVGMVTEPAGAPGAAVWTSPGATAMARSLLAHVMVG